VLLLLAFAARRTSLRSLGSKLRRRWLAVNAGDAPNAAPSDWMARRGCTPSACADRAAKVADNEPSAEGEDAAEMLSRRRPAECVENSGSGPQMETVRESTWPCPVGSSRHCAEPAETVLLPAAFATRSTSRRSLGSKPLCRWLAVECRRRARRRTTREGSWTTMRAAPYAQSEPRWLQATRSRRRRQNQNISAGPRSEPRRARSRPWTRP